MSRDGYVDSSQKKRKRHNLSPQGGALCDETKTAARETTTYLVISYCLCCIDFIAFCVLLLFPKCFLLYLVFERLSPFLPDMF